MNQHIETDIAIVGAGLVGLSAAIAFAQQGKKVLLLDAKKPVMTPQKTWDERVYALTPAVVQWLAKLGVWQHVDVSRVCDIRAMHVFDDENQPLILRDEDAHLPTLGAIIENQNLQNALMATLGAPHMADRGVRLITEVRCEKLENTGQTAILHLQNGEQIAASLIVAADGVNSWVRREAGIAVAHKSFNQSAIVANFKTEKNHQQVAYQWFAPHETLALLPLVGQNTSLVWSVSTEKAKALLQLSAKALAKEVELHAQQALGALTLISDVCAFALNQQTALQLVAERVALVGDAAHQIHPMAGQGLNLGFRDVMQLASQLAGLHAMQTPGDAIFLRHYARARKADMTMMNTLTTGLDGLFASELSALKQARKWGLRQLNQHAAIKKLLIQQVAA